MISLTFVRIPPSYFNLYSRNLNFRSARSMYSFRCAGVFRSGIPNYSKFCTKNSLESVLGKSTPKIIAASVSVPMAKDLIQSGHQYLDVRTPEEFGSGHTPGAINVPYMFKVGKEMARNNCFVEEVLIHFDRDEDIVVGCHSGIRSQMAADELLDAGFNSATNMSGGFKAWVGVGFPVEP